MPSLWMTLELAPRKRGEFLDAFRHALSTASDGPNEVFVYEAIGAPHRVSCYGRWESDEALDGFLGGAEFRTLCGAARVLGSGCTIERAATQSIGDGAARKLQ